MAGTCITNKESWLHVDMFATTRVALPPGLNQDKSLKRTPNQVETTLQRWAGYPAQQNR
jgi:hypothetical protein